VRSQARRPARPAIIGPLAETGLNCRRPYHGMRRRPYMPAAAGVATVRSVPPARHQRGLGPSSRSPA